MSGIVTEKIGRRRWRLVEPFRHVPAGFEFDGASVPRIFWAFLDPASEGFEAACLHDYAIGRGCSWSEAAAAFRADLVCYGVPRWRAAIVYAAVMAWGKIR
jgi:hypothetical protein